MKSEEKTKKHSRDGNTACCFLCVCLTSLAVSSTANAADCDSGCVGPTCRQKSPRIAFDSTICDLGEVGPGSRSICEFRFANAGSGRLEVTSVKSTCGCTVMDLPSGEYEPNECGTIKATYTASRAAGTIRKHIYVSSNDQANPRTRLTIRAKVVQMVEFEPSELSLSMKEDNGGAADIILSSRNGETFAVEGIATSAGEGMKVGYDPNVVANSFTLEPRISIEKLRLSPRGVIRIALSHPECRSISIPYDLLAEFRVMPPHIHLFDVKAGEPVQEEIVVSSNYNEKFDVNSVSSGNGHITLLDQEKVEKGVRLVLQITPPTVLDRTHFTDDIKVSIKDKDSLTIPCRGFYEGAASRLPGKSAKARTVYRIEPRIVQVRDTLPGKPVTTGVVVSSDEDDDFEVAGTSSKNGIVSVLSKKKVDNGWKLNLRIDPPPSKHRLGIYSDVLQVKIRQIGAGKDGTTNLPIICRGTHDRRAMR